LCARLHIRLPCAWASACAMDSTSSSPSLLICVFSTLDGGGECSLPTFFCSDVQSARSFFPHDQGSRIRSQVMLRLFLILFIGIYRHLPRIRTSIRPSPVTGLTDRSNPGILKSGVKFPGLATPIWFAGLMRKLAPPEHVPCFVAQFPRFPPPRGRHSSRGNYGPRHAKLGLMASRNCFRRASALEYSRACT
jgi:hypothetical protein